MTKTYDTYKDSGIAWIGEIPSEWTLVDAKRILKNEKKLAGVEADNYERLALTLNGVIKRSKDDSEGLQPEKFESYQILGKNELVFKLIDLQNISTSRVGISPYEGLVSPAYIVVKNRKSEDNKYYYWYMNMYFTHVFNNLGGDGVRSAINAQDLLSLKIPYISVEEQKSIASFLDKKCGEIDSLISLQEEMISELQSYKISYITKIVTSGIKEYSKLKDSGVDWIGQIPETWTVTKFKNLFRIKKDIAGKLGLDVLSVTQKGLKIKDLSKNEGQLAQDYSKYQLVSVEDFVMNHMDLLTGFVDLSAFEGVTSPDYRTFRTINNNITDNHYYLKIFQICYWTRLFYNLGQGVSTLGRWRLPAEQQNNFMLPVPPLEEQKEIAVHLDKKMAQIDSLIDIKEKKICELKDYKKSIIFEYVTGKKRV